MYYAIDTWHYSYISHHGVKGMKWGVRKKYNEYVKKRNSLYRAKMYKKTNDKYYKNASESDIQRERRKKIIRNVLIATAAVAVTGLAVYGATKIGREYCDTVLKSGDTLRIVAQNGKRAFNRPFYATDNALDAVKYRGMYGGAELGGIIGNDVYSYSLKNVGGDIKVAGKYQAQKIFNDLIKNDPEFAKGVSNFMKVGKSYMPDIKGKNYDTFGRLLAFHDESGTKVVKQFYSELSKHGYAGLKDINDMKYSGYNAKRAIIYFDKFKDFKIDGIAKLDQVKMGKDMIKGYGLASLETVLPKTVGAGAGLAVYGSYNINKRIKRK